MLGISVEIGIVLLLILFNGVLAMAEMATVTSRQARLQQRADQGDAGAKAALQLAQEPNRFLSTVQIGITLVGILAGAFGGATLASKLSDALGDTFLDPYSDFLGVAIVVASITYLSLIVGELVPKRIALRHSEAIASILARPMKMLATIAAPLVAVLSFSTEVVLRLFGIKAEEGTRVTEEEIRLLIGEGREAGVFEQAEEEMVERVFKMGDRRVSDIMTPRPRVTWLDLDDGEADNLRKASESGYGIYPVARGDLDQLVGMVSVRDLWQRSARGESPSLEAVVRPAVFVPETKQLLGVLEDFKRSGAQAVMVVDEFGGTQGLLTLTDVLEEIVGDINDEGEPTEALIVRRSDGTWLADGMLEFDDFLDAFEREEPDDIPDVVTLGGFVMTLLDRVPQAADTLEWEGLKLEVMDMDGHRVDKVLITDERHREELAPHDETSVETDGDGVGS